MTKAELRKIYLERRMSLSNDEHRRLSAELCDQFFKSANLDGVSVLHTFLPIQKTKEVDTLCIVERLREQYPNIRVAVPKMNNQTSTLENYYLEGPDQLNLNTWGIPEPVKGVPTPTEKIDVVLVPLLAFDMQGHRLGYGRGFYDRFLATCRPDCKKIGLSFFEMEERIDDVTEKDIPLDVVVTPRSVFTP